MSDLCHLNRNDEVAPKIVNKTLDNGKKSLSLIYTCPEGVLCHRGGFTCYSTMPAPQRKRTSPHPGEIFKKFMGDAY